MNSRQNWRHYAKNITFICTLTTTAVALGSLNLTLILGIITNNFHELWRNKFSTYPEVPVDIYAQEKWESFAQRVYMEMQEEVARSYASGYDEGVTKIFMDGQNL